MKNLIDTYGDPITYLSESEFNALSDVLVKALDKALDDGVVTPLEKTIRRLHIAGKNFYTQSGQFYELMCIDYFVTSDFGFTIDQFNSKEDMLNNRNPM